MFLFRLTYWKYTGSSEMLTSDPYAHTPYHMLEEWASDHELHIRIVKWGWIASILSWQDVT